MGTESTVPASLSPRAAVAMLSLQLRAAVQEADTAEADANAIDEAAAREQLRARLEPLIAERRRALDAALAAARTDASEAILSARTEARQMIENAAAAAEAHRAALAAQAAVIEVVPEPEVEAPEVVQAPEFVQVPGFFDAFVVDEFQEPDVVAELVEAEPEVEVEPDVEVVEPVVEAVEAEVVEHEVVEAEVVEPEVVEPEVLEPEVVEVRIAEPDVVESIRPDEVFRPSSSASETHTVATQAGAAVHVTVGIDAEAFAAAFASVFVTLIEERMGGTQMAFAPRTEMGPYIVTGLAKPPKPSFWSTARHLDVALVGLATTIVLVVLAAWLV